jgi:hypothetical protein
MISKRLIFRLVKKLKPVGLLFTVIYIVELFSLTGCKQSTNDLKDWETAVQTGTIEAFDQYLANYPEGDSASSANREIVKLLLSDAQTGNPFQHYDAYVTRYPEGANKELFEPFIYNYVHGKDSMGLYEEYVRRFPQGKYLNEFEADIFINIKSGRSSLTFTGFAERFPGSFYLNSIDTLLFDSLNRFKTIALFDEYRTIFPNGSFIRKTDSIFEKKLYETALNDNSADAFDEYLKRFQRSPKVKSLNINTNPAAQTVKILDNSDSLWKTITSPATVKAISGTLIKTKIDNPEFKTDIFTYTVSDENDQKLFRELKANSKSIIAENFSGSSSMWSFSANNNKSEIKNNKLICSVKNSQFQNIRKITMDLGGDYEMELGFKIISSVNKNYRTYVGLIWGEETKVKYYFLTSQGRYNYGVQSQEIGSENPYGYSGWSGYNSTADSWIRAENYVDDGMNILKIVKTGSLIKYYINNKYIFFENDPTRFRNTWVGIGIGNATAEISFIRIEQFAD